jgi:hypothetical protein
VLYFVPLIEVLLYIFSCLTWNANIKVPALAPSKPSEVPEAHNSPLPLLPGGS